MQKGAKNQMQRFDFCYKWPYFDRLQFCMFVPCVYVLVFALEYFVSFVFLTLGDLLIAKIILLEAFIL